MFLHTGSGAVVEIKDIITIIDTGVYGEPLAEDIDFEPKSVIVTKDKVYYSTMSSRALSGRLKEMIDIFYP